MISWKDFLKAIKKLNADELEFQKLVSYDIVHKFNNSNLCHSIIYSPINRHETNKFICGFLRGTSLITRCVYIENYIADEFFQTLEVFIGQL